MGMIILKMKQGHTKYFSHFHIYNDYFFIVR